MVLLLGSRNSSITMNSRLTQKYPRKTLKKVKEKTNDRLTKRCDRNSTDGWITGNRTGSSSIWRRSGTLNRRILHQLSLDDLYAERTKGIDTLWRIGGKS